MKLFKDEVIVLRTYKLKESDRIILVFGKNFGIYKAIANGVRKPTSKLSARFEPFSVFEVQMYQGKTFAVTKDAKLIQGFTKNISKDYHKFTIATSICEFALKSIAELEQQSLQYELLYKALESLSENKSKPKLIFCLYIFRALKLAGWLPDLKTCIGCFNDKNISYFDQENLTVSCANCNFLTPKFKHISKEFKVIVAFITEDWAKASNASDVELNEIISIVQNFSQKILETKLKSVNFI